MAEPRWSIRGATPASFGTDEAREEGQRAAASRAEGPQWTVTAARGVSDRGGAPVSWATLTGQNMEGTNNAFDTEFWSVARTQDEEQAQRGMGDRWTRPDATGVVVYNDESRDLRFGDVFLNGVKQGNLREGYAGLEKEQANEILARITLPREVWAKAYESEAGQPATLSRGLQAELDAVEQKNTEDYAKGLTAMDFEREVRETAEGYEDSATAQTLNVGAGALGGAAVGATLGSVVPVLGTAAGATVGALIGGVGAWLNRDEQFTRAAQLTEQLELAKADEHDAIGYADALSGIGGMAMGTLNPLRNVVRGAYDSLSDGGAGDSSSAWNNGEPAGGWVALDTVALMADGLGSFGNTAARAMFTSFMGATAGGTFASVGTGVASGNVGFNPYTGTYEDIGAGGMAMRAASSGIDIMQTRIGMGLIRGGRGGGLVDDVGGFRIHTATDGTRSATRLGWTALLPSEAATAISARMMARRAMTKQGLTSKEDLARQTALYIDNLTSGRKSIATMAVNGFGEGAEEFVQAGLDALSVGEMPTLRELTEAARQGFGMGVGMGYAVSMGTRDRSQQQFAAANVIRRLYNEPEIDEAQWNKLSEAERAMESSHRNELDQVFVDRVVEEVTAVGGRAALMNVPELQRVTMMVVQQVEKEARNSQPAVEPSRLSTFANLDYGPEDYVMSLPALIRDVTERRDMMQAAADGRELVFADGTPRAVDPELVQYAGRIAASDTALLQELTAAQAAIDAAEGDTDVLNTQVNKVNSILRSWWHANDARNGDAAYGMRRSASAWTARFPLNSAGSLQLLRFQVSPRLTAQGDNWTALVPPEVLPPTGGDHDGDRMLNMLREVLPDESYDALRYGAGQLTSDGTMLKAQTFTEAAADLLFNATAAPAGSSARRLAREAREQMRAQLHAAIGPDVPLDVRKRLVNTAVSRVAKRDAMGAIRGLTSVLATEHAEAMRLQAQRIDGSPWLRISRAIDNSLREFATQLSMTDYHATSTTGAVAVPATNRNMRRWSKRPGRAASEIASGALLTSSWNMFRLQTLFKYNPYREATPYTEDERQLAYAALIERFALLNDGIVRSGDEAMFDTTLVQERTLRALESLAREYQESYGTTLEEAMVLLAGARVPDVDRHSGTWRSNDDVTLLQAVMHDVISGMRREYRDLIAKDETVAMRLESLDAMTRPDREEGMSTDAIGGTALVEVFGSRSIAALLGDDAGPVGTYSVRGLRNKLMSLRADVREEFVRTLQAHPQYSQAVSAQGAQVTPYRVLIDNVVESARMELSETDQGLARGRRARNERTADQRATALHDTVRALLNARHLPHSTAEEVRASLERSPELAMRIATVMDGEGLTAAITRVEMPDGSTRLTFPTWVYSALAEPETARAKMMLVRSSLIAGRAGLPRDAEGLLKIHKVGDRIQRLWLDLEYRANDDTNPRQVLDRAAHQAFLHLLYESATVEEFLTGLNLDYRFRSESTPPYMAWDRDTATVSADRFGKGFSDVLDGQETRDALRDAVDLAMRELQIEERTAQYLKENSEIVSEIRASRDGRGSPTPWERFQLWLDISKDLSNVLSANTMIEQAAHINEITGGQGVKGVAPTPSVPMGRAIAAQLAVYESGMGRLFASTTFDSLGAILNDLHVLTQQRTTVVLDDGTVVRQEPIDASELLDLLDTPEYVGLAARMMGQTAWETNTDTGAISLTTISGQGVLAATQDPADVLFSPGTASKLRRLMVLEGKVHTPGGAPTLPTHLAEQMVLRESGVDHVIDPQTNERREMAEQIALDIADALQALASIDGLRPDKSLLLTVVEDDATDDADASGRTHPLGTGEPTTVLNRAILRAARRARQSSGNSIARMVDGLTGPARDATLNSIQAWLARTAVRATQDDDQVTLALVSRLRKDYDFIDSWMSPAEILVERFQNFDRPEIQAELAEIVKSRGDIALVAPWAAREIQRVQNDQPMLDKDWHVVARGTIAYMLHTAYGSSTSSAIEVSEFPSLTNMDERNAQLPYWDPSGVAPVVEMLVPGLLSDVSAAPSPLLQAQLDLQLRLAPEVPVVSEQQASDAVYKLFAPRIVDAEGKRRGVVGQWNALMPAQMHSAVGTVMASPAESGISMSGLAPSRLRMLAAGTPMDWSRRPADDELSSAAVSADQLIRAVESKAVLHTEIDVEIAHRVGTGVTKMPTVNRLVELEGRVVRGIRVTGPGVDVDLLKHRRFATGFPLPAELKVPPGEAGVLSVETLSTAVDRVLSGNGIPAAQRGDYTVQIDYFHPETKTTSATRADGADYDHSAWFDGLSGRTDAGLSQPSLLGFTYFGLDGMVPAGYETALQALKKLTFALQQVTTLPSAERDRILEMGTTDMSAMIAEMTRFVMKQKIDGKPIPTTNYATVRKLLELQYVVRHMPQDGEPEVLSAEKVIARQRAGEPLGAFAEVVGLPMPHVLDLMGEANVAEHIYTAENIAELKLHLEDVQPYTNFPADAWTEARFAGLVSRDVAPDGTVQGWLNPSLLDHPRLQNLSVPARANTSVRGQQTTPGRGFYTRYHKQQERISEYRANHTQANTKWAMQRKTSIERAGEARGRELTRAINATQAIMGGNLVRAAELRDATMETSLASHDYTTGWNYLHDGRRFGELGGGTASDGILVSLGDISQSTMLGDEVIVHADPFFPTADTPMETVIPQAREVLDALMNTGATINIPESSTAGPLVAWMRNYVKQADDYALREEHNGLFDPAPTEGQSQTDRAFESLLETTRYSTGENRVLVELGEYEFITENAAFSINGGVGTIEDYFAREVFQVDRYAGYAPPVTGSQLKMLANVLLPLIQSDAGRSYLGTRSGDPDKGQERSLPDAVEDLVERLEAVLDGSRKSLLPGRNEEIRTGMIIPLISTNERGELVGIHLMRHGHEPVFEEELRGALPEGNAALDTRGARLTIDRAKVDVEHTTHVGTVVDHAWLGPHGLSAKIRMKMADLGAKVFELGSGMKWTITEAPANFAAVTRNVFLNKPPLAVADVRSPESKNADQWFLNRAGRQVEAVGFNVMPHLTRALYDVDYAPGSDEYTNAARDVRQVLVRYSALHGGEIRPKDLVRETTDELETAVIKKLQQGLQEVLEDRVGGPIDLLDDSTQGALADATMLRLVASALASGAHVDEVLGAPGFIGVSPSSTSHQMNETFTTLLDKLPASHPAKRAFIAQINERMRETWARNGDGYKLSDDGYWWVKQATDANGAVTTSKVMLSLPHLRHTDHNSALSEMAHVRQGKGSLSGTTLAMANTTWGARAVIDPSKMRGARAFGDNEALHGTRDQILQRTFNIGGAKQPFGVRMDDDLPLNNATLAQIRTKALPARRGLSVPIDDTAWYEGLSKAEAKRQKQEFEQLFKRVRGALKLREGQDVYLVEMIRAGAVRSRDAQNKETEFLTRFEAMATLHLIERNADRKLWPLRGAGLNTITLPALQALYKNGYELVEGNGTKRPVSGWNAWLEYMVNEVFTDDPRNRRYVASTNIIDGVMYEYRKEIKGLPAIANPETKLLLDEITLQSGLIISSPMVRVALDNPVIQDGRQVYDTRELREEDMYLDELPQSARDMLERRMRTWEHRNKLGDRKRQSPRTEAKRAAHNTDDMARTNTLLRLAQTGFVLKTMVNPGLHVSAFIELANRGGQEAVTSWLSGSTRWQQGFTAEQRRMWRDTMDRLADNTAFYGMVYDNIHWNPNGEPQTNSEERLQRVVNFMTAAFNDPTWGTRGIGMANAFMEAAWDAMNKSGTYVAPETFMNILATNPERLAELNPDAVNMGFARIQYRRNLQDNLLERMRRWGVEGVINSGGPMTNALGTLLLRFPTMFFKFRSNTIINLLGLQAPHAAMVALMSDRTKRPGGLKDRLTGADKDMDQEITDQARIEDSYDLTRAIIRSGVSHTQLFLLGSALSAAGFGGDDDEEERFLNKLRRYQQEPVAKDPLALENDFRNASAWFSRLLPGGMGMPTWIIRMFVSPAMGVARFQETGDFRQVYWGFMDALGSMPLLNLNTVMNSWEIAHELQVAAEAETLDGSVEATTRAQRYLITALGTLEGMLFESAFASMIYQASDEWDRDPYAVPLRDSDGTIQRFKNGQPRPTDMLQDIPLADQMEGGPDQGYVNHNTVEATIRGLAENRPMLAHTLALIMRDSSYIRTNMVPKLRDVKAEALDADEAERLIMAVVNNETGQEELTLDGAEAVVRGIQLGTVRQDSPALQGVFIPPDMRAEIQQRVLEDLTVKYLEIEGTKAKALSRAKEEFYGQAFGEEEGLGFADILWGDVIPAYQTQKYMQLNTTYVMGPNNRPVATGVSRSAFAALGLPFEGFLTSESGNLPTDDLLNSVDEARMANLGMRGLVKIDESWVAPTPEEIGEGIEKAIREIGDKLDDLMDSAGNGWTDFGNGWRNFGSNWRSYGGGGYSRRSGYSSGGGYVPSYGGQAQRFNNQRRVRTAYSDDLYSINTGNPIIRRATIRRERFSSQRGRLNQWQ